MDLLFSMDAFRCRSCRARFHKFDPGGDEEPKEPPDIHREPEPDGDETHS